MDYSNSAIKYNEIYKVQVLTKALNDNDVVANNIIHVWRNNTGSA